MFLSDRSDFSCKEITDQEIEILGQEIGSNLTSLQKLEVLFGEYILTFFTPFMLQL